jgi:FkbM family methyltransferase
VRTAGHRLPECGWKAEPRGRVLVFEPHPHLFSILQGNVVRWRRFTIGGITAHRVALSNRSGRGTLHAPDSFERNCGLALLNEVDNGADIPVEVSRLDHYVTNRNAVGLLKVDVEEHELQIFQGSEMLLAHRGIRDIVFEEFRDYPTPVTAFLKRFGYTVYQLDMTF